MLTGCQTPTFFWVPPHAASAGQEAIDFARSQDLFLDPWQQFILDGGLAERAAGLWSTHEVLVLVSRQNGKGDVIEARELAGLFVFGERYILHSAHEQKTSNDAFLRMLARLESHRDLDRRVTKISRSKGEEGFEVKLDKIDAQGNKQTWKSRLRYMARTGGAGRGFTKVQLVILDEVMILDDAPIAAMLPTMATQRHWQVWYLGSAGSRRLRTESVVLARIRRRALNRDPALSAFLWEAHLAHDQDCPGPTAGCVLDVRADEATWAKVNPSLNLRRPNGADGISSEFIASMLGIADFDREFLGVGDYPVAEGWTTIQRPAWEAMKDVTSARGKSFAVGIESDWNHEQTSVGIASRRDDGTWHLEILDRRPGSAWVVEYCKALKAKRPIGFVIDPKGPSAHLIQDLKDARLRVIEPTLSQWATWCQNTFTVIRELRARHLDQPTLTDSARDVTTRRLGDGLVAIERTRGNTAPFITITLAMGAARSRKRTSPPMVAAVDIGGRPKAAREDAA